MRKFFVVSAFLTLNFVSWHHAQAATNTCVDQSGFWHANTELDGSYYWEINMTKTPEGWRDVTYYYNDKMEEIQKHDEYLLNGEVLHLKDSVRPDETHKDRRYFILCVPDGTIEFNYQAEVYKNDVFVKHLSVRTTVLLVKDSNGYVAKDVLEVRDTFWENNVIVEDDKKTLHREVKPKLF